MTIGTGDGLRPVPGSPEVLRSTRGATFPDELVRVRIAEATSLALKLTAGGGFSVDVRRVDPELAAAITACVTRSLQNPSLPLSLAGSALSARPGTFATWTDQELDLMARLRELQNM
jgi:hypothetical protein